MCFFFFYFFLVGHAILTVINIGGNNTELKFFIQIAY